MSSITLPVQWGDQDAFGHVNNTVFFRWFESARVEYLGRCGLWGKRDADGVGPILANISCNYRQQLTFPDTVEVSARVTRIGRSSITMEHEVRSQKRQLLIADGSSVIVTFDYRVQQSVPVPDDIRRAIETQEGRTF
ncbi:MAG: acyl-CoA thioesterase [Planctomycetes bacterium]|nr:acyl-CoA thioesterase [Planctomycetota bacterium]